MLRSYQNLWVKRLITFCRNGIDIPILVFFSWNTKGQSFQSWNDYDVIRFANAFSFDTELSYQTVLSRDGKWRSLNATPTLEWSALNRVDLIFAVPLSYTFQTDTLNTFETKLSIGGRLHLTPNRRILTRLLTRYEQRFVRQQEQDQWQNSDRLRIRGEMIVPINRKRYYEDKLLYALADYEVFLVKDNAIQERFANRARLRVGLGYRFSYSTRLEVIYTLQKSRNTLEDAAVTNDSILRIRFKHFLNRKKPTEKDGSGN